MKFIITICGVLTFIKENFKVDLPTSLPLVAPGSLITVLTQDELKEEQIKQERKEREEREKDRKETQRLQLQVAELQERCEDLEGLLQQEVQSSPSPKRSAVA